VGARLQSRLYWCLRARANGLASAIPLRFLAGVFLAGVYLVGMKLTGSWAPPSRRGLAFGVMIGALTLGPA
jgi:MFS family permease